ncbi:MAG TPA: copper chaperone PCu(A)C [Gammaproteobacteria bacterium]|nr:copper chaperone PCu(A)C [Gammaproteobacteria bacterium]
MLKKISFAFLLIISTAVAAETAPMIKGESAVNEIAANVISVKTPEVNMALPTQGSTQVFMELDNNGKARHKLIAAYSPAAKLIQLHQTIEKNGEQYMQQVPMISIKPQHEQDLKQGGFHVMLMGLNESLKKGHKVPVVLLFDDGSYINLNVPVE